MKVMHVVEATTAGVGRHVVDLCREMQNAGVTLRVACPLVRTGAERDTNFVSRLQLMGVPVDPVSMQRSISPLSDIKACIHLRRLFRAFSPDVTHLHSSKAGALGRLAAKTIRKRPAVIYTPNAFGYLGLDNGASRALFRQVERWLGHCVTDRLICVSRSELALARRQSIAPEDRLMLVENAIEASYFEQMPDSTTARVELGMNPSQPLIGAVVRLVAQKGLETLIKAANIVAGSNPDAQFVVVGEGEYFEGLQRMVEEYQLVDRIKFTGFRSDVRQVLAALDIYVLPSLYEGLSYSLMEAMAAGRAIVATGVVGNCDLVVHDCSGLLVPPTDDGALAAALRSLLNDPAERKRLGQGALAAARSRPTPRMMAGNLMEIYQSALVDRRTG